MAARHDRRDRPRRDKTVRGARTASAAVSHLASAPDAATGPVLGQLASAARSEISAARTLLSGSDLTSVVVTTDAMHSQAGIATMVMLANLVAELVTDFRQLAAKLLTSRALHLSLHRSVKRGVVDRGPGAWPAGGPG